MGQMLHRARNGSVMLATPAYAGVEAGYAFALFESVQALERAGITAELALFAGDCHVDDARNRLVRQFLASECEQLVFLDSDLRWEADDLIRLIEFPESVVGATYPLKQEEEAYPIMMGEARLVGELIEVEALPTGFLKIRRHVLETLAEKAPQYYGKRDSTPTPLIFERTLLGSVRWGGDTTFCRKWREAGGRVYLNPQPLMEHTGNRQWSGRFSNFLRKKEVGAIPAAIEMIREGRIDAQSFLDAAKDYGNPFVASPTFFSALMQAKGRVLECGSGLSTVFLAANGCEVYALEHDIGFAQKTGQLAESVLTDEESSRIHIIIAPLVNGWYETTNIPVNDVFDCLVVDGPPRGLSDRKGAEKVLPLVKGMVLTDDGFTDLPLEFTRIDDRVSVARAA